MDHYKETEKILYSLNPLKASIENMECELEELKEGKDIGLTGTVITEKIGPTNAFNSATENEAMYIIERQELLKRRIKATTRKVNRINRSIESLDNTEREIIAMRYLKGNQWWEIAYAIKFSERHCKRIRNSAIEKITIALF